MATPRKKMCKVRLPSASGQQASIFQFTSPIGQQSPARSTVDITVVTPASNRDATSSSAEENNREENQSKAPQRASRSIERTPKPRTTLQRAHQPSPNTVHHSTSNITPSHQPSEASNKENDREENQSKAPQRASRSIERTPKPRTTLQRAHQHSPNTVHHSTSNITPSHQPSEASNKENDREENQSKAPQRASRSIERTPKPRTTLQRAHQPSPNTVHHSTSNITPSHQPSEASNKENDSSCEENSDNDSDYDAPGSSAASATPSQLASAHVNTSSDKTPQPISLNSHASRQLNLPATPNQPKSSLIPPKQKKNQNVCFQQQWFNDYKWLHYEESVLGVVCVTCAHADQMGLLTLCNKKEPAFISNGFRNWAKAPKRFQTHYVSDCHKFADKQLSHQKLSTPVTAQIDKSVRLQQVESKRCLRKVFVSMKYLLRQGLPFRGHEAMEGNLIQMLHAFADGDPGLTAYISRTTNFVSPQSQAEIMRQFSHAILNGICEDIRNHGQFAVIVDGTQDISGTDQHSICFRHIGPDLEVYESFVGLYEMNDTTGQAIAGMIRDVLTRLNLPMTNLRAQTYDGAANMSGKYNGCQAKIQETQPLALFFHCGAHLENLVLQHVITECPLLRDSLQWVHELGVLIGRSGKSKGVLKDLVVSDPDAPGNIGPIKPLCPTRWLARYSAVQCVINQYAHILQALDSIADITSNGETAAKARGLKDRFEKAETYLALLILATPLCSLEGLNLSMQARDATVSGMLAAVETTRNEIGKLRNEVTFNKLFDSALKATEDNDLDPLKLPRQRKVPKRIAGNGEQYTAPDRVTYYRKIYFQFFDSIDVNLENRFDIEKTGLSTYRKLENMLISGQVDEVTNRYPELNIDSLRIQLQMFIGSTGAKSVTEAKSAFVAMVPEVRALFPQVFQLLILLLVCPVSSCEAERSFSALRRLKTWLRSTMTQERLNYVCVNNVHRERLDRISLSKQVDIFISKSEIRRSMFGNPRNVGQ